MVYNLLIHANPESWRDIIYCSLRSPKVTDDLAACPRALKAAQASNTWWYSRQSSQALTRLRKDTRTRTHASWFVAILLRLRQNVDVASPRPPHQIMPMAGCAHFWRETSSRLHCIHTNQAGRDTQSKGYILYMGRQPINALNSIPSTYMHIYLHI